MTESNVLWRCSINEFYKPNNVGDILRLPTDIEQSCWALEMFAYVADIVFLSTSSIPLCNQIVGFVASWFQTMISRNLDLILHA
jgi:hypothetical protein